MKTELNEVIAALEHRYGKLSEAIDALRSCNKSSQSDVKRDGAESTSAFGVSRAMVAVPIASRRGVTAGDGTRSDSVKRRKRGPVSAATRMKMAEAMKARWAKARRRGRNRV